MQTPIKRILALLLAAAFALLAMGLVFSEPAGEPLLQGAPGETAIQAASDGAAMQGMTAPPPDEPALDSGASMRLQGDLEPQRTGVPVQAAGDPDFYVPTGSEGILNGMLEEHIFLQGATTPLSGTVELSGSDSLRYRGSFINDIGPGDLDAGKAYQVVLPDYIQCTQPGVLGDIWIDHLYKLGKLQTSSDGRVYLIVDPDLDATIADIGPIQNAQFYFDAGLDMARIGGRQRVEIEDYKSAVLFTVNIKDNEPTAPAIQSKSGAYNASTGVIDWTVKLLKEVPVFPSSAQAGYVFSDGMAASEQEYVPSTFKVETTAVPQTDWTNSAGHLVPAAPLTYVFSDGITRDFTITYSTRPTAEAFCDPTGLVKPFSGKISVTNKALLTAPSPSTSSSSKSATVDYASSKWLDKKGKSTNFADKTVLWEIEIDTNGLTFQEINLYDKLPEHHTLVANSVSVKRGNAPAAGVSLNAGYTGTSDGTVDANRLLTLASPNGHYTVEYTTKFTQGADVNVGYPAINEAWITYTWPVGGPGPYGQIFAPPKVTKPYTIAASSIRKSGKYDASTGRITWEIEVNRNRDDLSAGIQLYDVFDAGNQTYVQNSLVIQRVNGAANHGKYPAARMVPSSGLPAIPGTPALPSGYITPAVYMVDLGAPIGTDSVIYTYQTQASQGEFFANNASKVFLNTAYLFHAGTPIKAEAAPRFTSNVLGKRSTAYDYQTKTVTWELTVNENKYPLTDVIIEDQFPSCLSLVDGSVESDGAPVAASQMDYTNNKLTLRFSAVSKRHIITYQTILNVNDPAVQNDFLIQNTASDSTKTCDITNPAALRSNEYAGPVNVTAVKEIDNTAFAKTGVVNNADASIAYTLHINQSGADMAKVHATPLVITDTLPAHTALDFGSVRLYKAAAAPDGTLVASGSALTGVTLTLEDRLMKVTLPRSADMTSPYLLRYTLYADGTGRSVHFVNNASIGHGSTAVDNGNDSEVDFAHGGGTANRGVKNRKLELTLTDADTGTPIPGAEYGIYEKDSNGKEYLVGKATTDSNGQLIFDLLTNGETYIVRELTPATGYTGQPRKNHDITINTTYGTPQPMALTRSKKTTPPAPAPEPKRPRDDGDPDPFGYQVISGGDRPHLPGGGDMDFRVNTNRPPVRVEVDGRILGPEAYTQNGNTITLKDGFLSTLTDGAHTLLLIYPDGTATRIFHVLAPAAAVPPTG